jgi:aldehyde:ferredoxin oxidoreductase
LIEKAEAMHGFYGRILKIDVGAKTFAIEPVDDKILGTYLGGKGLASYLLYTLNSPGVDPLAPENCLIFNTGPAGGTMVWGGSRYGVFTKSPQTGLYSESYSGGKVPEAIDAAGFDAIVIQGKAQQPTILEVLPDEVVFHPADDIWGMSTYDTEDAVLARFGHKGEGVKRVGAVVIGPAAENLVRFAVIENDYWRSAGRTGVGTVMGAKQVKAIVFKGDRKRTLYDPDRISDYSKALVKTTKDSPVVKAYKTMGTPMMVNIINNAGAFPTKYWRHTSCAHWEKINSDALHTQCQVKPRACLKCFMACGRMTTVQQGRHAGLKLEGPEYETLYVFGGLCMVDSVEEIVYLNDICDRLGMDTISAGNLCAFAIEASERGKIEEKLTYGEVDAVADLLHKIVRREGIGSILADGIRPAARAWGMEDIAVHVKGLEPAGYDPRVLKGMGLAYATSDRGACHLRTTFYKPEVAGMIDPGQIEGKAEMLVDFEDRLTLFDTLVLCRFYRDFYLWDELALLIHGLTGIGGDKESIQKIASNVSTLVRRFNLREGMKPEDDRLPRRFHQKLEKTGQVISEEELETMLKDYYRLRGWDEMGVPGEWFLITAEF